MSTADRVLEALSGLPGDALVPVRWIRDVLTLAGDGEPYAGTPSAERRSDCDYEDDLVDPGASHD